MKYLGILPKSLPKKYQKDFQIGKVSFRWVPLASDLSEWLLKELEDLKSFYFDKGSDGQKKYKKKGKSLLIMNALHHNVARKAILEYLKAFQQLTRQLKLIFDDSNNHDMENIRILYLSTVPRMYRGPVYFMEALSKIAIEAMGSIGIETFDLFSMLHSVNDTTADGIHFLSVNPSTGTVSGEFGPGVADAMINYICS